MQKGNASKRKSVHWASSPVSSRHQEQPSLGERPSTPAPKRTDGTLSRRPSIPIFFPKPKSVELIQVQLTDNGEPQPGMSVSFEAERGDNRSSCRRPLVITLPLNQQDDQYFMVALPSMRDHGVPCPGLDRVYLSKLAMQMTATRAAGQKSRTFITLRKLGSNYARLPDICRVYGHPGLPQHVFLGPFPAALAVTSRHMTDIRVPRSAIEEAERVEEEEEDVEEVERKPELLDVVVPKKTPLAVMRHPLGLATFEIYAEEVVRVRMPFLCKKFTGPMDAFKVICLFYFYIHRIEINVFSFKLFRNG